MPFIFTLRFHIPAQAGSLVDLVERLGAAGCDDALVGIGRPGRLALEFTRESSGADEAMESAVTDVLQTIPTARLVEAGPDFVGLSDVATLVGVSRQNLRQLTVAHADTFPPPVHDGSTVLWRLAPVLAWLADHAGYVIAPELTAVARASWRVNQGIMAGVGGP